MLTSNTAFEALSRPSTSEKWRPKVCACPPGRLSQTRSPRHRAGLELPWLRVPGAAEDAGSDIDIDIDIDDIDDINDIEAAGIVNAPNPAHGSLRSEVNSKVFTAAEWRTKPASQSSLLVDKPNKPRIFGMETRNDFDPPGHPRGYRAAWYCVGGA